ncbi:Gfo/Idh/MocA family oxidoreductase [Mesorhizobium sp. M1273]|uniref:Gfo/Idh/MocA family oxidoreductase n=1 Tax=Mesorhizobium sp. M1273 TaxID=2957075 RepID=UPI00333DBEF7
MRSIGVGIIGCGNISDAYLKASPQFPVLDIVGVADVNRTAAEAKAATYALAAMPVDALLADPRVEIVPALRAFTAPCATASATSRNTSS